LFQAVNYLANLHKPAVCDTMKSGQDKASIFRDDGAAFHRWGDLDRAEQCYLQALDSADGSKDHQTLYRMAELFLEKKDPRRALEFYILTIHADAGNLLHKQRFLDIGGRMQFTHYNADLEDALLQCLKVTPDLDFSNAGPMWSAMLRGNVGFAWLYADTRVFEKRFNPAPLLQTYFIEGLKKISVHEPGFEDFIRRLRQWLLMGVSSLGNILARADYLRLAEAVAIYCFYGDYIIRVTAAEQAKLREISRQLTDPLFAAVYACYKLQDVPDVFEPGSALADILKENEQITAEDVPTIFPKKQDEKISHPRWRSVPVHTLGAGLFFPRRKEKLERTFAGTKPELLVAGCGTGREAIIAALHYPKAKITTFDSCRENVAYAAVKSREYNVRNIDFRQDDILNLEKIPKPHDIIYSTGALHHAPDPLKAWQILRDNLKPAGIMKIGLASKTALRPVIAVREAIRKFNINDNRESILDFRARGAEFLPAEMLEGFTSRADYYSFSTYRDMFFHPGTHYFTLPEIEEALAKLRLAFEGFDLPAPALQQYAEKFPDDPDMVSLKNWHTFELEAPDIFAGMYQFWCRKF